MVILLNWRQRQRDRARHLYMTTTFYWELQIQEDGRVRVCVSNGISHIQLISDPLEREHLRTQFFDSFTPDQLHHLDRDFDWVPREGSYAFD